jgi:hypothetical protein
MSASELLEWFTPFAVLQVGSQHPFEQAGKFLGADRRKNLAADSLLLPKTPSDEHVICLDTLSGQSGFRAQTADVAHVMLSAGVRTTGKMNVHRLVKLDSLLQPFRQGKSMAFGVGLRVLAILVSGTSYNAAAHVRLSRPQTDPLEAAFQCGNIGIGHVGNDEVLPHSQSYLSATVVISKLREAEERFWSYLSDR